MAEAWCPQILLTFDKDESLSLMTMILKNIKVAIIFGIVNSTYQENLFVVNLVVKVKPCLLQP